MYYDSHPIKVAELFTMSSFSEVEFKFPRQRSPIRRTADPIPQQVTELMEAIRLRWLGQRMGLEKMVLKKGTLIGTFIADQKHPFFEGDGFNAVLRAVQAQPRRFKVYE